MRGIRINLIFVFTTSASKLLSFPTYLICLASVPKIAGELYCHILQLLGVCRRPGIP